MSQNIYSDIVPNVDTGTTLATKLNAFRDALMSGLSGPTRPPALLSGGYWIDTSLETSDNKWVFKLWTGVLEVTLMEISTTTGTVTVGGTTNTFDITKISADDLGPTLSFIKRRILSNGQVEIGDVIGYISFKGHNNLSGIGGADIESAAIIAEAADNYTDTESGSKLRFEVTQEGSNIKNTALTLGAKSLELAEKVTLVKGFEFQRMDVIPLSGDVNSLTGDSGFLLVEPDADNIEIRGIENDPIKLNVITVANNSEFKLTLVHDSTNATASERMILPNEEDLDLEPRAAIKFYHNGSNWAPIGGTGTGSGTGMIVPTYSALLAIPAGLRTVGMTVTVLNQGDGTQNDFWLDGGIANSNWTSKSVVVKNEFFVVGTQAIQNSNVRQNITYLKITTADYSEFNFLSLPAPDRYKELIVMCSESNKTTLAITGDVDTRSMGIRMEAGDSMRFIGDLEDAKWKLVGRNF